MQVIDPNAKPAKPSGIHSKMIAVRQSIGAIGKNKRMDMGGGRGYSYRGIEDLYYAVQEKLDEHRIATATAVVPGSQKWEYTEVATQRGTKTQTRCTAIVAVTFTDPDDGSYVIATGLGEGLDDSDKAAGKCTSYGMKNVYFHTFVVPTQDPDAERPDTTRAPKTRKAEKEPSGQTELVTREEFSEARILTDIGMATSLPELKAVWDSIDATARSKDVIDAKEKRKAELTAAN